MHTTSKAHYVQLYRECGRIPSTEMHDTTGTQYYSKLHVGISMHPSQFNFCSDCDSDELSIKNTKNKNKTSVSARKTNLDGNLKDNVSQIGEKSACDREGSLVDEEMSGNEGFVDDLNGDQFPPISVQDKVDDLGDIKDCLDQDIGDNGNRNVDDENSANRSDGCVSEPVCQDKVDKIAKKESDVNEGNNKLVEISTEINENRNDVVVLNNEMIESGCEKWKYTICGFFVGGQVTYSEARYHLRRMWNQFGYIDLMKNDGGKPIIMDEMTARMCAKGEGRLNFARVLIEVEAKK
ncbi:hypothetical protein Tco_0211119 [Tanacetum coccineum]